MSELVSLVDCPSSPHIFVPDASQIVPEPLASLGLLTGSHHCPKAKISGRVRNQLIVANMLIWKIHWISNAQQWESENFFVCLFEFLAASGLCFCMGFSLVAESRGSSSLRFMGFSLQWLLLLCSTSSRCTSFSSCCKWAKLPHSMWDLPGSGIEPMSPA